MALSFSVDVSRTKASWKYRRRTAFRNSKIRVKMSGHPNYERIWLLGFDIAVQWGSKLRVDRPQWSNTKTVAKPATS